MTKMKVVIADDNMMMLEEINRLIPWEQNGFFVAAKVFDGVKALEAIKETGVDILITDIKMPNMDGLELIRLLRSQGRDAKVIVLSSYNDFQLVREALRLGASEYIMKTELDPQIFSELLKSLSQQLTRERAELQKLHERDGSLENYAARLKEVDSELYRNRRHIKDGILKEFCHGYISEERFLISKKEYLNIRYFQGAHGVFYLCADNFDKLLDMFWDNNETLLSFAVLNVLEELLENFLSADVYYNGSGEFVVIFSMEEGKYGAEWIGWRDIFMQLSEALNSYLAIQISVGLSCDRMGSKSIPVLFQEAMKACQYRFALGKGRLILENDVAHIHGSFKFSNNDRLEILKNALLASNAQNLGNVVDSLIFRSDEVTPENFQEVLKLYERYSFLLYDYIEQNNLHAMSGKLLESFNEFIYDREAVPVLNKRLKDILLSISQNLITGNSIVRQLIKYLHNNYDKDITLQTAAEFIGINSAYLGRLVLKELGVSFSDYLNNYRIERAKEMLMEGRLKVYEIAEKVGYTSTEYFSKMFKKVMGINPKDFFMGKYN